jgi:5-hydroxyisourate hydrolase
MSLSTHVLDTDRGEPAAGIPVRLDRRVAGPDAREWVTVGSGATDGDGRLRDLVPADQWGAGRYRLTFTTGRAFFPEVTVEFEVADPRRHHHVPLLISAYGYTTYRGS